MLSPWSQRILWITFLATLVSWGAVADEPDRKITTIVGATTSATGRANIKTQLLSECIQQLPTLEQLHPVVSAQSKYLKMVNGDINDNRSVRTYRAVLDLTYVTYRKELVVVATNSIEKSEPVFKEVDGRFDQSMHFESIEGNGDQYAGRELVHNYFFSTPEAARADVIMQAKAWLQQKQAVLCNH